MSEYKPIEIWTLKFQYGIIISMCVFFVGLILSALHVLYIFFTPKHYLLSDAAVKKPTVIAECRPPPPSHPEQRKHRNRITSQPSEQKNKFFYIDTSAPQKPPPSTATSTPAPDSNATTNFDEEFLDRLKQDIRYYPKNSERNEELRREFAPHQHGRISQCPPKNIPKLCQSFELKRHFEDSAEPADSFVSVVSDTWDAIHVGETQSGTKTKTTDADPSIPDTPFTRFASKFLDLKENADAREVSHIPIKDDDSLYKTLKHVKHGF